METNSSLKSRLLGRWGRWAVTNWQRALLIGFAVTIILAMGFFFLSMEMTFYSILPRYSNKVVELKHIVEQFPLSSAITVVVEARDKGDRERAALSVAESVDALTDEFGKAEYSEYIDNVTGKLEKEFFGRYGLIIQKKEDLERFVDIFGSLDFIPLLIGLNNDFEAEYSGNEAKLEEDERTAVSQFRGLEKLLLIMKTAAEGKAVSDETIEETTDRLLFGDEYFFNRDNTMALFIIQPTFDVNDLEALVTAVPLMDRVAKRIAKEHGTTAGLTGLTVVGKDEMVTSEQGLALSMSIAFILIILLLIIVFRMFAIPLISGIPLLAGVVWTVGITGLVLHRLNIMTAMYMVVMIGLGIDYAIHLLTTFVQEKDDGKGTVDAMYASFVKSGSGIATGALTTAVAFFALVIAESEVVKELGFVAGAGIICEYCAMMIFIPALIGFRSHRLEKLGKKESDLFLHKVLRQPRTLPGIGKVIAKHPALIASLFILAGIVIITQAPGVRVEDNIMEMEAEGLESVELQDVMVDEFEMAPDSLSIRTSSIKEAASYADDLERLASVKAVDSIAPFIATEEEQKERLPVIGEFEEKLRVYAPGASIDAGKLTGELERLWMNFSELSILAYGSGMSRMSYILDRLTGVNEEGEKAEVSVIDEIIGLLETDQQAVEGLSSLQKRLGSSFRQKLLHMTEGKTIGIGDLPRSIRDAYISKQGDEYIVNIYPKQNPWIKQNRDVFVRQVESINENSTGMILVADQMSRIAEVDAVRASIVAAVIIFILLFLDFRNIKLSIITMLPLGFSIFSLFGIMAILGIKFDFINVIGIPLLIGIGIDDAVHISHRYRYEGKGKIGTVIEKTGAAIFMTSLTTMIGFASFIPSVMKAMKSTGVVLTIAIALAFVFSLFLHPSMLVLMYEKLHFSFLPWKTAKRKE
ncbi:MAG: MMPL family transporter [Spirochaetales bacterium]|nr:MMPL family transporter [Spirochaetales bacterium]